MDVDLGPFVALSLVSSIVRRRVTFVVLAQPEPLELIVGLGPETDVRPHREGHGTVRDNDGDRTGAVRAPRPCEPFSEAAIPTGPVCLGRILGNSLETERTKGVTLLKKETDIDGRFLVDCTHLVVVVKKENGQVGGICAAFVLCMEQMATYGVFRCSVKGYHRGFYEKGCLVLLKYSEVTVSFVQIPCVFEQIVRDDLRFAERTICIGLSFLPMYTLQGLTSYSDTPCTQNTGKRR